MKKEDKQSFEEMLAEKKKTHGDFSENADYDQRLKNIIHEKWHKFSYSQKLALEMIVHKIARLLAGNPDEPDHFRDIAGYATRGLEETIKANQMPCDGNDDDDDCCKAAPKKSKETK